MLQLSAQLDALRMNQQDYVVLESQAEIIREKYAALQAEKVGLVSYRNALSKAFSLRMNCWRDS